MGGGLLAHAMPNRTATNGVGVLAQAMPNPLAILEAGIRGLSTW